MRWFAAQLAGQYLAIHEFKHISPKNGKRFPSQEELQAARKPLHANCWAYERTCLPRIWYQSTHLPVPMSGLHRLTIPLVFTPHQTVVFSLCSSRLETFLGFSQPQIKVYWLLINAERWRIQSTKKPTWEVRIWRHVLHTGLKKGNLLRLSDCCNRCSIALLSKSMWIWICWMSCRVE